MCGTAAHTSFVHFETQPGYLDTGITLLEAGIGCPVTGDSLPGRNHPEARMSGKSGSKYPPSKLATGDESTARRRHDAVVEPGSGALRGRFSLVRDSQLPCF